MAFFGGLISSVLKPFPSKLGISQILALGTSNLAIRKTTPLLYSTKKTSSVLKRAGVQILETSSPHKYPGPFGPPNPPGGKERKFKNIFWETPLVGPYIPATNLERNPYIGAPFGKLPNIWHRGSKHLSDRSSQPCGGNPPGGAL